MLQPYLARMSQTGQAQSGQAQSGKPPLTGVRIVDFSRVIAGPLCTQILSDMGAEVIKIENPDGGDDTRKGAGPRAGGKDGESHFFMTYNRGKKSVALDFTKPEGQAVVHRLLATADVMVENFRPGVLKKYGLDATSDVKLVETMSSAVGATIKAGQAQIGNVNEPYIARGEREGLWAEPFLNIPKDLGPYAYSTLNVRLDSMQKTPELVQKFVNGVSAGLQFTISHPDEALAVAKMEFPTMSEEDLKATIDRTVADQLWSQDGGISQKSWQTAQSVVREAGILKQDVAYDDIIDMRFVNAEKPSK